MNRWTKYLLALGIISLPAVLWRVGAPGAQAGAASAAREARALPETREARAIPAADSAIRTPNSAL